MNIMKNFFLREHFFRARCFKNFFPSGEVVKKNLYDPTAFLRPSSQTSALFDHFLKDLVFLNVLDWYNMSPLEKYIYLI